MPGLRFLVKSDEWTDKEILADVLDTFLSEAEAVRGASEKDTESMDQDAQAQNMGDRSSTVEDSNNNANSSTVEEPDLEKETSTVEESNDDANSSTVEESDSEGETSTVEDDDLSVKKYASETPGDKEQTLIEDSANPPEGQIRPTPKEVPDAQRGLLSEDAGLAGKPGEHQEALNIPPEVQYGPSPNLYSYGNENSAINMASHVQPPGSATPVMNELVSDAQSQNANVNNQLQQVPTSELKPPQNFTDEQWNQLSPEEQVEYHGMLAKLNQAIDEHDYKKIVKLVNRINDLQDKMRKAFGYDEYEDWLEKSAKAPHRGSGARRPGSKYIWKEWRGTYWYYHYKDEPHSDARRHGIGKNAITAAATAVQRRKEEDPGHSIEVHPSIDTGAMEPAEAYRQSIKQYVKDSHSRLYWVERGRDGKFHVYRQDPYRQAEIRYAVVDEMPEDPRKVPLKKRISLATYAKKHMPMHESEHEMAVEKHVVSTDYGHITFNPYRVMGYTVHEKGEKVLPFKWFRTQKAAERALEFLEYYWRAKNAPDNTAKVFEGRGHVSVDPIKYPVLAKLEGGELEYEATKSISGKALLLQPILSRRDHEQLFKKELRAVIMSAIRLIGGYGRLSKETIQEMVDSAIVDLRQALTVRQGEKSGGFIPGPNSSFMAYAKSILRSPSGPLFQILTKYGYYDTASTGKDDDTRHLENLRAGEIEVVHGRQRGYISADEWKSKYLDLWRKEQLNRFELTRPPEQSQEELQKDYEEVKKRLDRVKSREDAVRFHNLYEWSSPPALWGYAHDVSGEEKIEGEEQTSTVEESPAYFDRLRSLIKETSRSTEGRLDPLMERVQRDFVTAIEHGKKDDELHQYMVNQIKEHYKNLYDRSLSDSEAYSKYINIVGRFVGHPDVRAIMEEMADKLERSLRWQNVPAGSPLYKAAAKVLTREKQYRLMEQLLNDIAPTGVKRKVLLHILSALQRGVSGKQVLLNIVNRYKSDISKEVTGRENGLDDSHVQAQIGIWWSELRDHALFKSLFMYMLAYDYFQKAEDIRTKANVLAYKYIQNQLMSY